MATESERLAEQSAYVGHTTKRARNSMVLDYLGSKESVIPGAFRSLSLKARPFYSPTPTLTPAIPSPNIVLPSSDRTGQSNFAGLSLPPLFPSDVQESPDKFDRIISLLEDIKSQSVLPQLPARKYRIKPVVFSPTVSQVIQIAAGDESRSVLFVTIAATNTVFIGLDPLVSASRGWQLTATIPALITLQSHGMAVMLPWYAFISANNTVSVVQCLLNNVG